MKLKVLQVNPPQYDKKIGFWVSHVNVAVMEGSLSFSKTAIVSPSWPGGITYEGSGLVPEGSSFSLRFVTDLLTSFIGTHPVVFKTEGGDVETVEVEYPGFVLPFYSSKWDAGINPTIKVGECSCVAIECVGLEPDSRYFLKNILKETGAIISNMAFDSNSSGIYQTRSTAEVPPSFPPGLYEVFFYGPGIPESGWKVDQFTIAGLTDTRLPEPGKCPPDRPVCPPGEHAQPVYSTVQPASCPIVGWKCVDNLQGGGGGGTTPPPKPSCSILWGQPFSGKIAERKQGEQTDVKLTVINLRPVSEFRLQNVHSGDGVISEMIVSSDSEGVLIFEDHESVLPFDWPMGSYQVKLLGDGVILTCGGFNLMAGEQVCVPGMVLGPGGSCIPVAVDKKVWILVAIVAAVILLSRSK